jgi:hypothetical protein
MGARDDRCIRPGAQHGFRHGVGNSAAADARLRALRGCASRLIGRSAGCCQTTGPPRLRLLSLGAASSSCSYAAVALARSIFRKGANFTAAIAFEIASTNLILELSIIMLVLLGWHFALAKLAGARSWSSCLSFSFARSSIETFSMRRRSTPKRASRAGWKIMAEMDMSVTEGGSLWQRLRSERGFTAISHYFVDEPACRGKPRSSCALV